MSTDKDNKILIDMHAMGREAAGIIVPAPTGVIYSNQVGGTRCAHPELEGFFIPWPLRRFEKWAHPLHDFYGCDDGVDVPAEECILWVRAWLNEVRIDHRVECLTAEEYVSFGQILAEAWAPVRIAASSRWRCAPWQEALAGRIVIYTWQNSD